jgi:hypothetical protein
MIILFHPRSTKPKNRRPSLLQRRRRADRQKIVDLADRIRDLLGRNCPSHAPSRDAVGLRHAIDGHRPLAHPFQ